MLKNVAFFKRTEKNAALRTEKNVVPNPEVDRPAKHSLPLIKFTNRYFGGKWAILNMEENEFLFCYYLKKTLNISLFYKFVQYKIKQSKTIIQKYCHPSYDII